MLLKENYPRSVKVCRRTVECACFCICVGKQEGSSTKGADLTLATSPLTAGVGQAHHNVPAFSISFAQGFQDFLCDEGARWPAEHFLLVVFGWKTQFSVSLQDALNAVVTGAFWGFLLMGAEWIFKDLWCSKRANRAFRPFSIFSYNHCYCFMVSFMYCWDEYINNKSNFVSFRSILGIIKCGSNECSIHRTKIETKTMLFAKLFHIFSFAFDELLFIW